MASSNVDFTYVPHNKSTRKEESWLDALKPDFSLKSATDYYATMRFFGYFFSGLYSTLVRKIEGKYESLASPQHSDDWVWEKGANGNFFHAKKIINLVETALFLGVTAHSYFKERDSYKQDFSQAVACEKGIDPSRVDMGDIGKSENPIIKSVINRHRWSTVIRSLSDIAFGINLKLGLVLKAGDITYERAAFVENVAYDILKKTVNEVQNYKLGNFEREFVKKELMRAVQRSLIDDHTTEPLTTEQIQKNEKVFDHLTDSIIQNKLGIKETVYLLGQVIKQPDNPEKTMLDLSKIEQMGMDDFCRAKMNGRLQVPLKRSFTDMARQTSGVSAAMGT